MLHGPFGPAVREWIIGRFDFLIHEAKAQARAWSRPCVNYKLSLRAVLTRRIAPESGLISCHPLSQENLTWAPPYPPRS